MGESALGGIDMAKLYLISCRDAGVDCDFQARGSSLEEVMQLCADHGAQEHDMKAFGPELYTKMRRCVKILEEGTSGPTS
jgi:predicted small metal-binding protein